MGGHYQEDFGVGVGGDGDGDGDGEFWEQLPFHLEDGSGGGGDLLDATEIKSPLISRRCASKVGRPAAIRQSDDHPLGDVAIRRSPEHGERHLTNSFRIRKSCANRAAPAGHVHPHDGRT